MISFENIFSYNQDIVIIIIALYCNDLKGLSDDMEKALMT